MCKKHLFVDLCQNVLTEIKGFEGNHTVSQSNNPKAVNGLSHTNVATFLSSSFVTYRLQMNPIAPSLTVLP